MMKKKKLMVTTFSYPPFCARCGHKVTCKVLQSGTMVCYKDIGKRKIRKVL
jgi:hypothetical protein